MTEEQAKARIKEAGCDWKVFMRWMRGQTVGIRPDGKEDIYDYDVNRFIRMKGDPRREKRAEFD